QWANCPARTVFSVDQVCATNLSPCRLGDPCAHCQAGVHPMPHPCPGRAASYGHDIEHRFTEAYGLSMSIAQAGMASVGLMPDLVIAVSNAGAPSQATRTGGRSPVTAADMTRPGVGHG